MRLGNMSGEDVIRMAHAGGGFRLDAAHRYPDALVESAAAAKAGGATVIFAGMARHDTNDVIRIATAGPGAVICED
jgi:phosphoribosylcarboxyaminoimidazole (NCAIR) mutase